jgi:outer membrane usher protein
MGAHLRLNSRQETSRGQWLWTCGRFAVVCSLAATAAHAAQPGETTQAQERRILIEPSAPADPGAPTRLNTTGRALTLTVPARDGAIYLGDVVILIDTDDRITFSAPRLFDLLSNVLNPDVLDNMRAQFAGSTTITPVDLAQYGIAIRYNPQALALDLEIPSERRATRTIQVSPLDHSRIGEFVQPAGVSAALNVRGNADYQWEGAGDGFQAPVMFVDGAVRLGGPVFESEAIWSPGGSGTDFQRLGSRAVIDDVDSLLRITAGDLEPIGRGFQSVPEIAGLSLFRSYSTLAPQQIIRPRGDRMFQLDRPSTVEVLVNGQSVRRLQLDPGTYDLRDLPFTQGSNDIRLAVIDDTGRTEILRFNVFLDQSQLARGLTEFGVYAGVLAPLGFEGPDYSDDFAVSGFIRHGLSDYVTLGGNIQADESVRMAGIEGVFGTVFGTIGGNLSLSDVDGRGTGWASRVTFQRLIQRAGGQSDSLTLFFESRSRDFGPLGVFLPDNPFRWEVGGGYSHAFTDDLYGGLDARLSRGRDDQRDLGTVRGTLGWRVNDRMSVTGDLRYERDNVGERVAGLVSLTVRVGRRSSVRAEYDTRFDRARASFNTVGGQGVGSYNVAADVERSNLGSGVNAVGNYYANQAELGVSHFGTFDDDFGSSTSQRTSFRFASSLAIADGAVSIGRPIYDSFAIVRGHEDLKGAEVLVDPSPFGFTATTGVLGSATHPNLSSYSERTITINAPNAPAGFDLGSGSFRVFPPYRSGYNLMVGSDYNLTATGSLLNADGSPVSLLTGTATELAHPERAPVQLFTNREGRFGLFGLAPGRWRIEMLDDQRSVYVIDVPEDANGIVRLGELRPTPNP